MARQPHLVDYDLTAVVVHPADRELRSRCAELTAGGPDSYEGASVRLAVRAGDEVVGTARVTLWSPVVGFLVEHEPVDAYPDLSLGPRSAELSDVVVVDPALRERVFLALAMLASRVSAAHGIENLYVVASVDDVRALDGFEVETLGPTVARVDLHSQSWEPRRAG